MGDSMVLEGKQYFIQTSKTTEVWVSNVAISTDYSVSLSLVPRGEFHFPRSNSAAILLTILHMRVNSDKCADVNK